MTIRRQNVTSKEVREGLIKLPRFVIRDGAKRSRKRTEEGSTSYARWASRSDSRSNGLANDTRKIVKTFAGKSDQYRILLLVEGYIRHKRFQSQQLEDKERISSR